MEKPESIRVSLHTHGCKLNQAESETIALQFAELGYDIGDNTMADVMLLNTCTVTHVADRKARQWVRQARRHNPDGLIVVTGCYAERAASELKQLGANIVCGNRHKAQLARMVAQCLGVKIHNGRNSNHKPQTRTRSFLKIQDGCHGSCAYCIVPQVRPDLYSYPSELVIDEVNRRVSSGYKEVVLTGTEIGDYNHDTDNLTRLVRRILNKTSVERLHLSSLHPDHITPEILELWQNTRLVRHFHIALQSGCDVTLNAMQRHYSTDTYRQTLDAIRRRYPNAAFTTDLIIGFPGESEHNFAESCAFVEECGFSTVHVFPFSPRPGTTAASMGNQISLQTKRERTLEALRLANNLRDKFQESQLSSVYEVLWETETLPGSGVYSGLTSNYLRVFTQTRRLITNQILPARLTRFDKHRLWCELV